MHPGLVRQRLVVVDVAAVADAGRVDEGGGADGGQLADSAVSAPVDKGKTVYTSYSVFAIPSEALLYALTGPIPPSQRASSVSVVLTLFMQSKRMSTPSA